MPLSLPVLVLPPAISYIALPLPHRDVENSNTLATVVAAEEIGGS